MSDDTVIPFPTRPGPDGAGNDPAELVSRLMAAGQSPQEILARISAYAATMVELPRQRPPELLAPREQRARYILRIDLDGAAPPIWRRLEVASDLTLDRLHLVVQAAVGWTDSHLHAFRMGPKRRDRDVQPFPTAYDLEEGDEGVAETEVRLDQTVSAVGDRLFYAYDFGDGWEHTLELQKIEAVAEGEEVAARVTAGRRACPPEDVGGIHSYADLVAALSADGPPEDEWLRGQIEWLPDGFDPAAFDLDETNQAVAGALEGRWGADALPFTHPELVELVVRLGPGGPLDELMVAAQDGPAELSPGEVEAAVRPLTILLDLVGEEGAELTGAGRLRPAAVQQLAEATGISTWWIGKVNREDQTAPVAALRSAAQHLGLMRKYRQRLRLTKTGLRVRRDPGTVWELLVNALPAGREPYQRQAGLVALLLAAAGRKPYPFTAGAEVLSQLGWRLSDGPLDQYAAYDAARPTLELLKVLDAASPRSEPSVAAATLARAALRPGQPGHDQDARTDPAAQR